MKTADVGSGISVMETVPLEYASANPHGRWRWVNALWVYVLMLLCIGIAAIVVLLILTFHLPRAETVAATLGVPMPTVTTSLFEFSHWCARHGVWLLACLGALIGCGGAYWIQKSTGNRRLVWTFAAAFCLLVLVLALVYTMWWILSDNLTLSLANRLIRLAAPPASQPAVPPGG